MSSPPPPTRTILVPTEEELSSPPSWAFSPLDGVARRRSMHLFKKSAHALGWNNKKKQANTTSPLPSPDSAASVSSPPSSRSPTIAIALLDRLSIEPEGMTNDDAFVRKTLIERIQRLLVALDVLDAGIRSETEKSWSHPQPKHPSLPRSLSVSTLSVSVAAPSLDDIPTPPFPKQGSHEWRTDPPKRLPPILAGSPQSPTLPITPTPVQKFNPDKPPSNVILPARRSASQRRGSSLLGQSVTTSISSVMGSAGSPASSGSRHERSPPPTPLPPLPTEANAAAASKLTRLSKLSHTSLHTRAIGHTRNKTVPNITFVEPTLSKHSSPGGGDPFAANASWFPLGQVGMNGEAKALEDVNDTKRLGKATERLRALQDRLKAESRVRAPVVPQD